MAAKHGIAAEPERLIFWLPFQSWPRRVRKKCFARVLGPFAEPERFVDFVQQIIKDVNDACDQRMVGDEVVEDMSVKDQHSMWARFKMSA